MSILRNDGCQRIDAATRKSWFPHSSWELRRSPKEAHTRYSDELLPIGEQRVGNYNCYVAEAIPKRHDKYLFEGKIWIDVQDHAIVRIEGHPAKRLSFWIERADFVREYQKIEGFWFPRRDQTLVHVRMYGTKILTIDHADYVVNGVAEKRQSLQTPGF